MSCPYVISVTTRSPPPVTLLTVVLEPVSATFIFFVLVLLFSSNSSGNLFESSTTASTVCPPLVADHILVRVIAAVAPALSPDLNFVYLNDVVSSIVTLTGIVTPSGISTLLSFLICIVN